MSWFSLSSSFLLSFFLSSSLARCKKKGIRQKNLHPASGTFAPGRYFHLVSFVLFLSRLIIISTIHLSVATISIPVSCDYSAAATILTSASLRLRNWIELLNVPISLSHLLSSNHCPTSGSVICLRARVYRKRILRFLSFFRMTSVLLLPKPSWHHWVRSDFCACVADLRPVAFGSLAVRISSAKHGAIFYSTGSITMIATPDSGGILYII